MSIFGQNLNCKYELMILIVSKFLVPKGFSGISIYPFVFLRSKTLQKNQILLNHERIHLRQQIQLGIILFFIWYIIEYLFFLLKTRNKKLAYHNISFEKEAYANETNLQYLNNMHWWNFTKYYK